MIVLALIPEVLATRAADGMLILLSKRPVPVGPAIAKPIFPAFR